MFFSWYNNANQFFHFTFSLLGVQQVLGAVCELEIRELTAEDAGEYSCVCGQEKTSATLTVRGKDRMWPGGAGFGVVTDFVSSPCTHPTFPSRLSVTLFP